jgi:hypothetical protein
MIPSPRCLVTLELPALAQSDSVVATAAVHRSAFSGLERYLRLYATVGAHGREHLAAESRATETAKAVALCPFGLTAGWAALRLIGVASGSKQFLFFCAEGEISPAIRTL